MILYLERLFLILWTVLHRRRLQQFELRRHPFNECGNCCTTTWTSNESVRVENFTFVMLTFCCPFYFSKVLLCLFDYHSSWLTDFTQRSCPTNVNICNPVLNQFCPVGQLRRTRKRRSSSYQEFKRCFRKWWKRFTTTLTTRLSEIFSTKLMKNGKACAPHRSTCMSTRVFHNCTFSKKNKCIAVRTPPGCI